MKESAHILKSISQSEEGLATPLSVAEEVNSPKWVAAKDLMLCKLMEMAYCPIHKPIYNSASNVNYPISLFNQNIELIKEHCQPVYRKILQVPVLTKLKTGSWISSSKGAYDVSNICPQKTTRQYTVFPGVELINLNRGCSAKCRY